MIPVLSAAVQYAVPKLNSRVAMVVEVVPNVQDYRRDFTQSGWENGCSASIARVPSGLWRACHEGRGGSKTQDSDQQESNGAGEPASGVAEESDFDYELFYVSLKFVR